MKCYNVYINSKSKFQGAPKDIILIKEGFNWACFIFGSLWALYKRVWTILSVYLIVMIVSIFLVRLSILTSGESQILNVFASLIIAFSANDYYGKSLVNKGYKFSGITHGRSKDEALLRFLDNSKN